MPKLDFVTAELARLRAEQLYNVAPVIESPQGAWIVVEGRRVLNLCSNNYLGLANDEALKQGAREAMDRFGVGPAAGRTIAGTTRLHLELEKRLSEFKRREATLSVPSGLIANLATIPSLADSPEDVIITDELNHASIIDGARLSRANRVIYRHADIDDLRARLTEARGARRRLIVTDGVFSMDGDLAPLPEIVRAAGEHDAIVMVDDAHGEGVLGDHGRGTADHFGLHEEVDAEVGTLSKAFGVVGGFISGSAALIDYLRQKARAFIFSSATTPADVGACLAAVNILIGSDARVKKLRANGDYLKAGLRRAGFDVGASATPITPVILGENALTREFSRRLYEKGVFATPVGFPLVPRGRARLRCIVSAAHETAALDLAVGAFVEVGREMGVVS